MKKTTLIFAFLLATLSHVAIAQPAEIKAVRVAKGPRIDGDLSDSAWRSAGEFTDFRMVEPTPNADPTEKTKIQVLYDDANL